MGTYVPDFADPPFEWGTPVISDGIGATALGLVEDKYTTTMADAEEMRVLLLGYLETWQTAIDEIDVDDIIVPILTSPTLDSTTITAPTVPSDAGLFAALLVRLNADITNGATGLSATVEQAIWDRADARLTVVEAAEQTEIEEFFSSRGFDLPTGALTAKLQEHLNKRSDSRDDLNDKILIQSSELAQKNSQFVITVAKDIVAVLLDNETKIFTERSRAQSEKNKVIIDQFEVEVKNADMYIRAAIAEGESKLGGYTALAALRERIISGMANIAMQHAASLYGATNMTASLSHQTGFQKSESTQHGESRGASYGRDANISENHQIQHDPV